MKSISIPTLPCDNFNGITLPNSNEIYQYISSEILISVTLFNKHVFNKTLSD